jgi:glycogen debranching enzyme
MLTLGALLLLSAKPEVRIGNFFLSAPNGIAMVWGPTAAVVIDFGGDYVAGVAAPDDSYHRQKLSIDGHPVVLEWGRVGNGAIGRLSSPSSVTVPVALRQSWQGISTEFKPSKNGFAAQTGGHQVQFVAKPEPMSVDATTAVLSVDPREETYFSLGIGAKVSGPAIDAQLDAALEKYEARTPQASGDWGDVLGAISSNMNNSRLYASDEDRVAISVSRGWAANGLPNEAPYFCWDSFFNGNLASLDDPAMARETVRAILSWQTPEGLVPNYGHWLQADKSRASVDRSQPPVGSMCIWKMHQRWPDLAFLKEVYPRLLRWHRWWPKYRDGDHDGLLEWGSTSVGKQGALWETGWDDTPEYAESNMVGPNLDTDAVDLNALWSMDAEYLAEIASAVGDKATAAELRAEREHTNQLINERLWNPALGIYCSRKWESKGGQFLTRLTPMNFYPLICGAPSASQAKSVLAVLTDPQRFWGKWVLPTVPYNDPLWPQQGYWHGTIWGPVNYLVFQGLKRYASPELISSYAAKSVRLFMRNWNSKGWCGENFGSDNGVVNGDQHYTWGALLCLIGLESVCSAKPDGTVVLNGAQTATMTFRNVPLGGKVYTVSTGPGWAKLSLGGAILLEAHQEIARIKL